MRKLIKQAAIFAAKVCVWPAALLTGFGRWAGMYLLFAEAYAMLPGIVGSYLRCAYYSFTVESWGPDCGIGPGSYFAHANASVGAHVLIGAYCVMGKVTIGDRSLVSGGTQILSGANQHRRDASGRLTDEGREFVRIEIGPDCWIGANSVIMASLGRGVTVAAASVVARAVSDFATVAGNPARPVRQMTAVETQI